jgi:hypothetical protein
VEEPPFLLAVQRIIGRIKVKNDLPRRALNLFIFLDVHRPWR